MNFSLKRVENTFLEFFNVRSIRRHHASIGVDQACHMDAT